MTRFDEHLRWPQDREVLVEVLDPPDPRIRLGKWRGIQWAVGDTLLMPEKTAKCFEDFGAVRIINGE